jgi:hypothetical protein
MTRPNRPDSSSLDDPWRRARAVGPGPTGTQPIPISPTGGYVDSGSGDGGYPDDAILTQPGGSHRARTRSGGRGAGGRGAGALLLEIALAVLVAAGVAAAMGWRVLSDLSRVIPGSGSDPFIELWSLAWSGQALKPGSGVSLSQIFDGNAFYPADYSLAFTDSLLGYGPITWFFGGTAGLVTAYNLIFVFAPALSSLGAYALARQLGAHPIGAAVAGAGFAYAPWHYGQFAHLHVLSTGPMVLALAMLARGHGLTMNGRWSPARPHWALLGWVVAAWQLTIGFALGLPFGYLLAAIGLLAVLVTPIRKLRARRQRRAAEKVDPFADPYPDVPEFADPASGVAVITPDPSGRTVRTGHLILADLVGAGLFAAVGALMAFPYLRVRAIDPQAITAARGLDQVLQYSPKPIGLVSPPNVDGTWSRLTDLHAAASGSNELLLLPGAILLALALLGLAISTWRWWWRVLLLGVIVLVAALSLGRRFPDRLFPGPAAPFVLLWRHVPGWAADRTPGRLMVFVTLALALLAAGAVSRLGGGRRAGRGRRAPRLWLAVLMILPALIVAEGWAKIPLMPVPAMPAAFDQAVEPTVVLPSVWTNDSKVMFWSATRGFPAVGNGQSGITPTTLIQLRADLIGFPDQRSVNYLRENGFRTVVVLRTALGTDLWQDADRVPDPALGLTRRDLGDSVLYTVGPVPAAP